MNPPTKKNRLWPILLLFIGFLVLSMLPLVYTETVCTPGYVGRDPQSIDGGRRSLPRIRSPLSHRHTPSRRSDPLETRKVGLAVGGIHRRELPDHDYHLHDWGHGKIRLCGDDGRPGNVRHFGNHLADGRIPEPAAGRVSKTDRLGMGSVPVGSVGILGTVFRRPGHGPTVFQSASAFHLAGLRDDVLLHHAGIPDGADPVLPIGPVLCLPDHGHQRGHLRATQSLPLVLSGTMVDGRTAPAVVADLTVRSRLSVDLSGFQGSDGWQRGATVGDIASREQPT